MAVKLKYTGNGSICVGGKQLLKDDCVSVPCKEAEAFIASGHFEKADKPKKKKAAPKVIAPSDAADTPNEEEGQ